MVPTVGGNQTYLEKDMHPWAGSTDTLPITMCVTRTHLTYNYISRILTGGPTARCVCSSVHVRHHLIYTAIQTWHPRLYYTMIYYTVSLYTIPYYAMLYYTMLDVSSLGGSQTRFGVSHLQCHWQYTRRQS